MRSEAWRSRFFAIAVLAFVVAAHGSATNVDRPAEVASAVVSKQVTPTVPTSEPQATTTPTSLGQLREQEPSGDAESTGPLAVSSVTPWVDSDGEFQVRFAPNSQIPADAKLTYTIHQSLVGTERQSLRSKLLDVINGGPTGKVLQAPVTRPIVEYGDPAAGAVVTIPVRSRRSADSTRAFLPNPGIHPVDLVLTTSDGPELWSQVVFLNHLPRGSASGADSDSDSADRSTRPVTVSMILAVETDPVFSAALSPQFSLDSRFLLDSTTELLTQVPDAPLRLGLRPDTFAGLSRVDEGWARNLVTAIGDATGTDPASVEPPEDSNPPSSTTPPSDKIGAASVLTLPFIGLDVGGLANPNVTRNAGEVLLRQLLLGADVLSSVSSGQNSTTWTLDQTVTNESLPLIKAMNFTDLVVPASRIETRDGLSTEDVMTGPVQLGGPSGLRAVAYDDVVSQQLSDPSLEPAIRAHDAVALLMSNWFNANRAGSSHSAPTSVFMVPPTTDAAVIKALAAALSGDGPLRSSTGESLIPPPSEGIDEPTTVLTFRPLADVATVVSESMESQRQIDAVASLSQSAEPALAAWSFLNAETFAVDMSAGDRQRRHSEIRSQVALKFGAIETPPSRRVVLAARQTTIPLRFRNNLPYQVHMKMQARSPRLDVLLSDDDVIVLEPGENRIDLPVDVRAPGQSLLRVQLSTPDGSTVLAGFDIPVNSTSISGVGSALSIISIVFLLLWWLHTLRKRRREVRRAESQHPAATAAAGPGTGTVDQSG